MSDLLTNLNSIYTTKLQIKEAIGTSSDVFADYPGYISSMVLPDGTAYITANGVSDISSYQYVDVAVPSSGGDDYQWIELNTSTNSLTVDTAYSFNGQLGSASQTTVTAELVQQEPNLAPYIGYDIWEVLGIYNGNNTSKFIIADNISSYASYPIIVEGVTKSIFGSNMVIADHVYPTNFAGGNGSLTIQSNGTQDVTKYSYVNVSVSSAGSSFEHIANFSSPTLSADSNYVFEAYNKGGNKIKQSFIENDVTDATAQSILKNYINPNTPDVDNILYNFSPGNDSYNVRCWCIYDNGSTATAGKDDYDDKIMSVSAKFLYDWNEEFEHIYLFLIEDRSKLYEVSEGGTTSLTINHNGTNIYVGNCKTVDAAVEPDPTQYLFGGSPYLAAYNTITGETTIIQGNGSTDESFVLPLNFNVSVNESGVDVNIADAYKLAFYRGDGDGQGYGDGFVIPFVPFGGAESQFDGATLTPSGNTITITYHNVSQAFNYGYTDSNRYNVDITNIGSTIDSSSIKFETDYVESGSIYKRLLAVNFVVVYTQASGSITWHIVYHLAESE